MAKVLFLRELDLRLDREQYKVTYVTPEHGGTLRYDGGIETTALINPAWMPERKRANQFTQFREQVVGQFSKLETLVLRELETMVEGDALNREPLREKTFGQSIQRINKLLDNVKIVTATTGLRFEIGLKTNNNVISPEQVSSGEAEIISLAVEALVFEKEVDEGKRFADGLP